MMSEKFSDEMLMRFADGELDAEEMAVVEKAMESDDVLVARVVMFIETKAAAQAAFGPLLEEPVPPALKATIEGMVAANKADDARGRERQSTIVPIEVRQAASRPQARQWTLPLAASIVAAMVGGLAGYWVGVGDDNRPTGLSVAGVVDEGLAEALATVPAGQETKLTPDSDFRAIATFRNAATEVCREFEIDAADRSTVISVACHAGDGWQASFVVAAPANADGYAPASSTEALDAYLLAIEAGEPLSSEEEGAVLSGLRQ